MATKIYGATGLTGGGIGAMDSIDGNILNDQDKCFVSTSSALYVYHLDSTDGSAESSPYIISPDTNAGTKRWLLVEGFKRREVGRSVISLTATSVSITFSRVMPDTSYIVTCQMSNVDQGAGATKYVLIITAKTTSGFTVEFSNAIDAGEAAPYLEWTAEMPL
jgi:hypothetical protein